ncbi:MAG: NAD(P)/FAD-dependent oxidoreductase [Bacilli bacterium]|nr:NAD(P)/FAD-dependent oxidoreductase [Bacilli bacterium]
MREVELAIIGGGSAGLAAAVAAYDNGIRDIVILERGAFLGGILNQCIHNGFGLTEFKEELTGPEFAARFIKQVEDRNIEYYLNSVVSNLTEDKVLTYQNSTEGVVQLKAKAIVMAAGCLERSAGAIALPGDRPAGVMSAGQAQLFLNQFGYLVGKRVFILGSGDIGLIMARRMTLEGAKVLGVAELCAWSNGLNRNMVQCLDDYGIPLYLSHTVTKVVGKSRLEKVIISEVDECKRPIPGTEKEFDCDTLILSIGLIPNNGLLNNLGIAQGRSRGSEVDENFETSIPGIFSAGNVLHVHDLVDNVVEEARVAGINAAKYIKGEKLDSEKDIKVTAGNMIGYVVPAKISSIGEDKATFKFRVREPSKNVYIVYTLNGKEIKKVFKPVIIPSEMEIQSLPKSLFNGESGELVVSLIKKEEK